jgi:DNA-binding MarR family transcriptional regulator
MLDALTLDQMRIFAAVAETGSFSAAARRLGRVQSAVSQSIAGLEDQLGVALFDRSGKTPKLTPGGTAILARAPCANGRPASPPRSNRSSLSRSTPSFPTLR